MEWHHSIEILCSELGDEAQLRSRLHTKQHMSYRRRSQCYSLPVVILSTICGSGNFVSESFENVNVKKWMILGIGVISILTSIIGAIATFLKLSELSESNRIASIQWGKFFTRIRTQLSLIRTDRESCHDYLMSILSEYDRLQETSPPLHDSFVSSIKKKLTNINGVILPYYLNGFNHTQPYPEYFDEFESNTLEDEKISEV